MLFADIEIWLEQTVGLGDVLTILVLVILEGLLSIDNALVLGLLARRLPKHQQKRALTYGLVGAFVFRFLAIAVASFLLQWPIVKLLGGGYLIYVAGKYFIFEARGKVSEKIAAGPEGDPILLDEATGKPLEPEQVEEEIAARVPVDVATLEPQQPPDNRKYSGFWATVAVIELTDIAFAVDSILAAMALVGGPPPDAPPDARHPKLWVVLTGGMLGVILMRYAAVLFIKLLEAFPRFETTAYLLVSVIGAKLVADFAFNTKEQHRLDFHDFRSPAFWTFWLVMLACFLFGFIPKRKRQVGVAGEG